MTEKEFIIAEGTTIGLANDHNVNRDGAQLITIGVLAALGLFRLPNQEVDPHRCTALALAWHDDIEERFLGWWSSCEREPGHEGDHYSRFRFRWSDGHPGTVPAIPADAEADSP